MMMRLRCFELNWREFTGLIFRQNDLRHRTTNDNTLLPLPAFLSQLPSLSQRHNSPTELEIRITLAKKENRNQ